MDNFELNENIGRQIFKEFLDQARNTKGWTPTEGKFDKVDGHFYAGGRLVAVEIKTRDPRYAEYDTHLIELQKAQSLMAEVVLRECDGAIYANIFGDSLIYLYAVDKIDFDKCEYDEIYTNRTTAENHGKIQKPFYKMPVKFARIFKKYGKRWVEVLRKDGRYYPIQKKGGNYISLDEDKLQQMAISN